MPRSASPARCHVAGARCHAPALPRCTAEVAALELRCSSRVDARAGHRRDATPTTFGARAHAHRHRAKHYKKRVNVNLLRRYRPTFPRGKRLDSYAVDGASRTERLMACLRSQRSCSPDHSAMRVQGTCRVSSPSRLCRARVLPVRACVSRYSPAEKKIEIFYIFSCQGFTEHAR